ncbi:MAG: DUF4340 domain-containing protein [Chitinophagaceae bacterium]|nr:DUF4340 domain-containing protein [Oligoflexus sp.]
MKLKGFTTPLAILLVLLVLAGLAFWDEKKTGTDKIAKDQKGKLFDFKIEDITSIAVVNPAAIPAQWTLKKEAGTWKVNGPIDYPADGEGIERFLKIIVDSRSEREFERSDKDLKAFGLDHPQLSYNLTDKDGKTYIFAIGGKSPTGYSSYLMTSNTEHLYLVNQYMLTATNKTLLDFRNRSLFIPKISEIVMVEMICPGQPPIKIIRNDKDWEIQTPFVAKGDTTEMSKVLNGWDQVRVVGFIDSPVPALRSALTEIGKGTKEYAKVVFGRRDQTKQELAILENNGKLYVKFSNDVFAELDKNQIDSLKRSAIDVQDRSMFSYVSSDVTELMVDAKHYHKVDKRWVEGPENKRADYVQGILVSLEFAKADLKLSPEQGAEWSKDKSIQNVTVKQGDTILAQFSVWKKPGDPNAMIIKSAETYYQVKPDFLEIFSPKMPEGQPTLGGELKNEKS